MKSDDIVYLERLATRLSHALYYDKLDAIGINGSVSSGLHHDDYDRLRQIAKSERIASLKAELATLEGTHDGK
jgi:hypothetical protein